MSRKHIQLEQLDGAVDDSNDGDDDQEYAGSKHYWSTGWLGGAYQSFLDANETVKKCDISEDIKNNVKENILESRKEALGKSFADFPPWSK